MALTQTVDIVVNTSSASSSLSSFGAQANQTQGQVSGLSKGVKALVASLAATVSIVSASRKLVDVTRQFDIINASLITATGSAENASKAFEAIQDFATKTPFALEEVANSFVKLRNLGLTPSERALESYGNTASAMGKSLDQFIEAVADASTSEFERLKEFGIKAKQQGDEVSLTFQGVTKTIGNNSQEIQEYLLAIGETEFAGAMEQRARSLDGAISNLGDTWDQLFLTVSKQGAGSVITKSVRLATSSIQELIDSIKSKELQGTLIAFANNFELVFKSISDGAFQTSEVFGVSFEGIGYAASETSQFIIDSFKNMPANIVAFVQIITIELLSLVSKAKEYGSEIAESLNPSNWFGERQTSDLKERLAALDEVRAGSLAKILKENETATSSLTIELKKVADARKKYDDDAIARAKNTQDRLSEFGLTPPPVSPDTDDTTKKTRTLTRSYEELLGVYDPLVAAQNDYREQLQLISESTATDDQKIQLATLALTAYKDELNDLNLELSKNQETANNYFDALKQGFADASVSTESDFDKMRAAGAATYNSLANGLTEFISTGELDIKSFASTVIAEFVKIAAQKAIAGFASSIFGGIGGGGNTATITDVSNNSVAQSFPIPGFASGGIPTLSSSKNSVVDGTSFFAAGEVGKEAILPLTRTSSGNLGVEAITGGGSGTQVVNNINITSDGSAQVEETSRSTNSTGGLDLNLMVRRAVETGISNGQFDASLGNSFGLRRRGA